MLKKWTDQKIKFNFLKLDWWRDFSHNFKRPFIYVVCQIHNSSLYRPDYFNYINRHLVPQLHRSFQVWLPQEET